MTYYSRAKTGLRPTRGATALNPADVEGIALHWPAMSGRAHTVAGVQALLRGWQNHHMDTNDWSDIAYQEAIDQAGNVYELRGLGVRSGANGDADVNRRFGALLLVVGPGEQPTAALTAATRERIAAHRARFPKSRRIVGHGQIRPGGTQCPGPAVQGLIGAGSFNPQPAQPAKPARKPSRGRLVDAVIPKLAKARRRSARTDNKPRTRKLTRALTWLRKIKEA
ncbi:peptidoglycan recognition protein family protein [Nocardioides pantholopis]|uniref:peptidoglycan recognition protein family protein n=1 Tax=Nocardioides pantholopis TaxID=2483798 RepID=UPI000FD84CC0|nr:peptidoglycan recognition family protein [Nocardioides pantholopis]